MAGEFPFAYYGEGSARPIREKDGLHALVVFEQRAAPAELKAIAATAPAPMRTFVKTGKLWLSLETSDVLAADIRAWKKASGGPVAKTGDAAYRDLANALTAWIRGVHETRPVALFFVGASGPFGAWHADTVARFGELVRPVLDALRRERGSAARAHAEWISRSFQHAGVETSFADIRALADDDPAGYAGDIRQRYRLARPLVDALGTGSLPALGPYGELGFWACDSEPELAPDPAAHAVHLARLADACPARRKPAVKLLLVFAAASMMRGKDGGGRARREPGGAILSAAIAVARKAARIGPLEIGLFETLVDAARAAGGAAGAVAAAKPFAEATLGSVRATAASRADDENLGRVASVRRLLERDLQKAPDASLAAILARAPAAEPEEQPIQGAKRPHLARLNNERLTVTYRGSVEDQVVSIELRGWPGRDGGTYYANAVERLIAFVNAGLGGGTMFAPEIGEASLVSGSKRDDPGPDYAWKVRVKGVAPELWAVALNELAGAPDMTDSFSRITNVAHCPKHLSIIGALAPDRTPASATTDDVLGWLDDPAAIFSPWAELPFEVRTRKAAATSATFKPERMTKAAASFVAEHYRVLHCLFDAHPRGGDRNRMASHEASRTQMKIAFRELSCSSKLTRGPLLNFARRLHLRATPLASVELALG